MNQSQSNQRVKNIQNLPKFDIKVLGELGRLKLVIHQW